MQKLTDTTSYKFLMKSPSQFTYGELRASKYKATHVDVNKINTLFDSKHMTKKFIKEDNSFLNKLKNKFDSKPTITHKNISHAIYHAESLLKNLDNDTALIIPLVQYLSIRRELKSTIQKYARKIDNEQKMKLTDVINSIPARIVDKFLMQADVRNKLNQGELLKIREHYKSIINVDDICDNDETWINDIGHMMKQTTSVFNVVSSNQPSPSHSPLPSSQSINEEHPNKKLIFIFGDVISDDHFNMDTSIERKIKSHQF